MTHSYPSHAPISPRRWCCSYRRFCSCRLSRSTSPRASATTWRVPRTESTARRCRPRSAATCASSSACCRCCSGAAAAGGGESPSEDDETDARVGRVSWWSRRARLVSRMEAMVAKTSRRSESWIGALAVMFGLRTVLRRGSCSCSWNLAVHVTLACLQF